MPASRSMTQRDRPPSSPRGRVALALLLALSATLSLACETPRPAPVVRDFASLGDARRVSAYEATRDVTVATATRSQSLTASEPQDTSLGCARIMRIAIEKARRTLRVTCSNGETRSFRVALGQLPVGLKRTQGDLRTPEGFYRVAAPPHSSRFHRFMLLDYPSLVDADRALVAKEINARTYLSIARAVARGETPPQNTALGGAVGIHGEGSDHRDRSRIEDWTYGCIALTDADMDFIADRISVGTPVSIEP